MLKQAHALLLVSLVIVLIARLVPTIITDTLFSTDSWPLLHNVKVLEENPNANIFNDKLFDGYNNHWPYVILFAYIESMITSINSMSVLKTVIPLISGFSALMLICLFKRIANKNSSAYILPLILFMMPSLLIFTSAATKETFTYPLFYTLLLIGFLKTSRKTLILTAIISTALVLSHHLTSMIALLILVSLVTYTRLREFLTGKPTYAYPVFPLLLLVTMGIIHTVLIGSTVLLRVISVYDMLNLSLYVFLFLTLVSAIIKWRDSDTRISGKGLFLSIILTLAVIWVVLYSIRTSVIYGLQPLGIDVLFYSIPLLVSPTLIYIGLKLSTSNGGHVYILSLIAPLLGLALYFAIGNPIASSIVHRVLNFILIPISMTYALPLGANTRSLKILASAIVAVIIVSSIIVEYRLFVGDDNITYYWVYRSEEYYSMCFLKEYHGFKPIIGDSKVYYLAQAFNITVSQEHLSKLIEGYLPNMTAYLYYENFFKGFVISVNIIKPKTSMENMVLENNIVYNNIMVNIIKG